MLRQQIKANKYTALVVCHALQPSPTDIRPQLPTYVVHYGMRAGHDLSSLSYTTMQSPTSVVLSTVLTYAPMFVRSSTM